MKVVIRVDSSQYIGTGHVMRCLTLADGFVEYGVQSVTFVCRDLPGNIIHLIKGRYDVVTLPFDSEGYSQENYDNEYDFWLGATKEQDRKETAEILKTIGCDMLVVDHYTLDEKWETPLRQLTSKIFVIDDLANRKHDCDFLVDQNYYSNLQTRYRGLVNKEIDVFLGPKYALIRKEINQIRAVRNNKSAARQSIKNILVFLGGADIHNITLKLLQVLLRLDNISLSVNVVVGSANPHKEQVKNFCSGKEIFSYHEQPSNFPELLAEADFCFGAGGSSNWERLCIGLPSAIVSIADNQDEICLGLEQKQLVFALEKDAITKKKVENILIKAEHNYNRLVEESRLFVDGQGVNRVLESVFENCVSYT